MTKFVAPEVAQILAKICSGDPRFKAFQAKKSVPETLLLKTWAAHTYPNFCRLPLPGLRHAQPGGPPEFAYRPKDNVASFYLSKNGYFGVTIICSH